MSDESIKIPFMHLGIDPGVSGGMVALLPIDKPIRRLIFSSADHYVIRNWIEDVVFIARENYCHVGAVIEDIGGFMGGEDEKGQKKNIASAHTMFTLGESFGSLKMALCFARISYIEVRPQKWQNHYGISPRIKTGPDKETTNQFKNRLKKKAQELFPEEKITLSVSDAFILAHYCQKLFI